MHCLDEGDEEHTVRFKNSDDRIGKRVIRAGIASVCKSDPPSSDDEDGEESDEGEDGETQHLNEMYDKTLILWRRVPRRGASERFASFL